MASFCWWSPSLGDQGAWPGAVTHIQSLAPGSRLSVPYCSAVVLDSPRLLARNSTYEHPMLGTGYTDEPSRALSDEPEAVPSDYQALLTARADRNARQAQLAEWESHRASILREIDWLH